MASARMPSAGPVKVSAIADAAIANATVEDGSSPSEQLFPASRDGKVGYIDGEGAWKIAPQFEYAWGFPNGEDRACVLTCEGMGYVDRTGRVAIRPRKELLVASESGPVCSDFHDGRAVITDERDRTFIIDPDGTVLVTLGQQHSVSDFSHERAVIEDSRGFISYVDLSGRVERITPGRCGYYPRGIDADGRLAVEQLPSHKWGYLDDRGGWAIAPQFERALRFDHGFAVVVKRDGKPTFVDTTGRIVPIEIERVVSHFSEGLAAVLVREGIAFMDGGGQLVVPPHGEWKAAGGFSEGLAAVAIGDSRSWGYVDRTGSVRVPPRFGSAGTFHSGIAPVTDPASHMCGYINRGGDWIVAPLFRDCPDPEAGVVRVGGRGITVPDAGRAIAIPQVDGDPWPIEYLDARGRVLGHLSFPDPLCPDRDAGGRHRAARP